MMRFILSCIWLLTFEGALVAQAAKSDFTVEASTAPGLKGGQALAKGALIDLPVNAEITLIDRTGSKVVQRVCVGAYKGAVEACTGRVNCSTINRMMGLCKGSNSEAGGVEAGAVRGAPAAPKEAPPRP